MGSNSSNQTLSQSMPALPSLGQDSTSTLRGLPDGRPANISPLVPKPVSKKAMRLYNTLQQSVQSTWMHLRSLKDETVGAALAAGGSVSLDTQSVTAPTLLDLEPGLQGGMSGLPPASAPVVN